MNIDIHEAAERTITYQSPSWYSYDEQSIIDDTTPGANRYRLLVTGLDEAYQAIEIRLEPHCKTNKYHVVAKVCVPWTKGFEYYHFFT